MLSICFLEVRCASSAIPPSQEKARWSARVDHDGQLQRTRFIELARVRQKQGSSAAASADSADPERTSPRCPLWEEELEVQDSGSHDTIEIKLDLEPGANKRSDTACQSIATMDVSTFRRQPDKRCSVWLPLRAATPHADNSFDAIKLAVTYYSEDCVAQGYVFALFCGLLPTSLIEDFEYLVRQIKGTKKDTARIQSDGILSATEDEPRSTPPRVTAAIQARKTPSATEVAHVPIPPKVKAG